MNKALIRILSALSIAAALLTGSALADCIGGAETATDVNLRSGAGTENSILSTLPGGTDVIVIADAGNGWYKVNYAGTEGYMSAQYLNFSETMDLAATGTVNGTDVNMRSGAGTSYSVVRVTAIGESVDILGVAGNWYKVSCGGETGYIRSDYVDLTVESGSAASTGEQIVAFAKQYLGYKYVWSAESPSVGFDCSGFVSYVFESFGYEVNRTAASMYSNGTAVSKSELQPGDAVFFCSNSSSSINHVGLYIGDGYFIHSSSSAGKVVISELDDGGYYERNYVGARRIAN